MSVLVIAPHPDDEAIGCGGALRKHALRGDGIRVVFLTSGEAGGHGLEDTASVREAEAAAAASILGIRQFDFWREPDGRLRATDPLANKIAACIEESGASIVYAPHAGEMHPDHRAANRMVTKALGKLSSRPSVRTYEVWTPLPDMEHIEDITDVMDVKLAAVRAYESQCRVMRFDEAVQGLNRYRGEFHSWPGGNYAEVFGELGSTP